MSDAPRPTNNSASLSSRPWLALGALALAAACVGLPVNGLFGYALLVVAAVILFCGPLRNTPRAWLAALAFAAIAVAGHLALSPPLIQEGFNAFLVAQDGTAKNETGLPDDAFRKLQAAFDAQYPPATRCDEPARGCWRAASVKESGFAFSADGLYDRGRGAFSRRVAGIGFSDPAKLRLGVANERAYNWLDEFSDVEGFSRARSPLRVFDRYRLLLPMFVVYRFPAAFAGSELCWRGDVLWEGADEQFAAITHAGTACRTLAAEDVGRRIVGVSIRHDRPLAMSLNPPASVMAARAFHAAFTLLGVAGIVFSLAAWRGTTLWPRTRLPFCLIGLALAVVTLDDAEMIGGFRPLDHGDDGIIYVGIARDMLRALVNGDIVTALIGGEPVFIFTPLMRYVRALEMAVFGDTSLLYLSALLAIPLMMLALCRRFMPEGWAFALALVFTATPLGALFGSSFHLFARAAGRGYTDSFAYALALGALLLIVPRFVAGQGGSAAPHAPDERSAPRAFWGGLLLALAIMTRPNLLLAAGVMAAATFAFALMDHARARAAALLAGFSVVLLSPLHNYVFGGSLIPFSDNMIRPETMRMLPSAYFAALGEALRLDFGGPKLRNAVAQLSHWLSGPGEFLATIPLNAFAVALLAYVGLLGRGYDRWLRAIALAALLQHGIGVCYVIYDRYHLLTWLLTALVFWAWVARDGLRLFAAYAPAAHARLAASPPVRALGAALDRLPATFARG